MWHLIFILFMQFFFHSFLLKVTFTGGLGRRLGRRSDLLSVICLNARWDWFQQAITRRRVEREFLKWMSTLFLLALRLRKKRIPSSGGLSRLSVSTSAPSWRLQGRRQWVSQAPRRAPSTIIYQTDCEADSYVDRRRSHGPMIPKTTAISGRWFEYTAVSISRALAFSRGSGKSAVSPPSTLTAINQFSSHFKWITS